MSEKPNVSLDDYRAALVKCEALRTENAQLSSQLADSTEALSILKVKFEAAEKVEKDDVVIRIVTDSKGKFTRESLEKMALPDLYIVKDALDKASPKTFVSVMRDAQEGKIKPKLPGTVGSYNQDTKTYEGGL